MHIVYISREYPPSLRGGGIATYIKIMAEEFAARGERVTVIAASDDTSKDSDEIIHGVRVVRLSGGDFCIKEAEPNSGSLSKLRFIYRFKSYRKKIRNFIDTLENVDIIEVAEYGAEGLFLNGINIPVVYRLHTPALLDHIRFNKQKINKSNFLYYYSGLKELRILKNQAHYITSCSTSLKEWCEKWVGIEADKIKVIYNPLQPDFISKEDYCKHEQASIFFAGTICDWKGAGDLVEACEILLSRGIKIQLKMAGKVGAFGEILKHKYKNHDWLNILGKIPQNQLKQLYRSSDVVCFPSWWENMPMVCIEAMALGCIVIGSDSGGMSEIIEDGRSGFLLPPKQPSLWADKIIKVFNMTEKNRLKISNEAQQRVQDVFNLNDIADQTYNYYQFVINDYKR